MLFCKLIYFMDIYYVNITSIMSKSIRKNYLLFKTKSSICTVL